MQGMTGDALSAWASECSSVTYLEVHPFIEKHHQTHETLKIYELSIKCAPVRQESTLTSDQKGAASCSGLIDDVTCVFSIAVTGEATHRVLCLIACVEVAGMQKAGAQTPLVLQYT